MFKRIVIVVSIFFSTSLFAMTISEVNLASNSKLMEIKGIGVKKADAIIGARKKAKFKSIDDLLKVKGIGKKLLINIKNNVKKGKKSKRLPRKTSQKKLPSKKPLIKK